MLKAKAQNLHELGLREADIGDCAVPRAIQFLFTFFKRRFIDADFRESVPQTFPRTPIGCRRPAVSRPRQGIRRRTSLHFISEDIKGICFSLGHGGDYRPLPILLQSEAGFPIASF